MAQSPFIELQRVKRYFAAYLHRAITNSEPEAKISKAGKKYQQIDISDAKTNTFILRWIYCNQRNGSTYLLKKALLESAEKAANLQHEKWAYLYYPERVPIINAVKAMQSDDGTSPIKEPEKEEPKAEEKK
jgi:hypothetical protein